MRSFGSLALRQVRARRMRALLTAAGIVLGVGMILGVLLLAATINRTFTDLFESVYGKTDLVVAGSSSGGEDALRASTLRKVRRVEGVAKAEGRILSVFTLVEGDGLAPPDASKQVNVAGSRERRSDGLTDARTIAGHPPRRGAEISLLNPGRTQMRSRAATGSGSRRRTGPRGSASPGCSSSRPGSTSAARGSQ